MRLFSAVFRCISIVLLCSLCQNNNLFGSSIVEMEISPKGKVPQANCFRFQVLNHESQLLWVMGFRNSRFVHVIAVQDNGDLVPDSTAPNPTCDSSPGVLGFSLAKSWPIYSNTEPGSQEFKVSVASGSFLKFPDSGGYYLVAFIRKPESEIGVLFSPIVKFSLTRDRRIECYSNVCVVDLPLKVKAAFLKESIRRIANEKVKLIKGDLPFE